MSDTELDDDEVSTFLLVTVHEDPDAWTAKHHREFGFDCEPWTILVRRDSRGRIDQGSVLIWPTDEKVGAEHQLAANLMCAGVIVDFVQRRAGDVWRKPQ